MHWHVHIQHFDCWAVNVPQTLVRFYWSGTSSGLTTCRRMWGDQWPILKRISVLRTIHVSSQLARKYSRLCRRHSHTSKVVTLLFYFLQAGHPSEGTTVIKHAIHKQKVYTKQSEKWSFSWCKVRNLPNVTASRARTNVATYEDSLSLTTFPNPVCNWEFLRMRLSHCLKIYTF